MHVEGKDGAIPANRRGRNRQGYYVALLHALELLYELERVAKGGEVWRWRPLPRYRPDQFAQWAVRVVADGGEPLRRRDGLVSALEGGGLGNVAAVLAYVGQGKMPAPQPATAGPGGEAHPQARKVALAIRARLDPAWRRALMRIRRRHEGALDAAALALGGLPPNLPRLIGQMRRGLIKAGSELALEDLTLLPVYGLMTGGSHAGVVGWKRVLQALAALPFDEVIELRHYLQKRLDHLERPYRLDKLPAPLAMRLAPWLREVWEGASVLLTRHWPATFCYLEDVQEFRQLRALRSSAELHLFDPFPSTVRYLNAMIFHHFEQTIYRMVGEVLSQAEALSQEVWLELLEDARQGEGKGDRSTSL